MTSNEQHAQQAAVDADVEVVVINPAGVMLAEDALRNYGIAEDAVDRFVQTAGNGWADDEAAAWVAAAVEDVTGLAADAVADYRSRRAAGMGEEAARSAAVVGTADRYTPRVSAETAQRIAAAFAEPTAAAYDEPAVRSAGPSTREVTEMNRGVERQIYSAATAAHRDAQTSFARATARPGGNSDVEPPSTVWRRTVQEECARHGVSERDFYEKNPELAAIFQSPVNAGQRDDSSETATTGTSMDSPDDNADAASGSPQSHHAERPATTPAAADGQSGEQPAQQPASEDEARWQAELAVFRDRERAADRRAVAEYEEFRAEGMDSNAAHAAVAGVHPERPAAASAAVALHRRRQFDREDELSGAPDATTETVASTLPERSAEPGSWIARNLDRTAPTGRPPERDGAGTDRATTLEQPTTVNGSAQQPTTPPRPRDLQADAHAEQRGRDDVVDRIDEALAEDESEPPSLAAAVRQCGQAVDAVQQAAHRAETTQEDTARADRCARWNTDDHAAETAEVHSQGWEQP